jgi:hypothetical protein
MAKKPRDKPRKQRLKVFRTPIGFHDAYVAAPSQKAALEAWGADSNLFAQGIAEQVDDPALIEEPLARPGEVVRRLRGSEDEHVAALGKGAPKAKKKRPSTASGGPPPLQNQGRMKKEKLPRPPKPSREELDAAEAALEKAEKKQRKALREIDDKMQRLERERRDLERRHERERDKLAETVERARSAYERAKRQWKRL